MLKRNIALALCTGLLFQAVSANEADKQKPIKIVSDEVLMDSHKHYTVYTGHVIANQGTTNLAADKVITYEDNQNNITKIIAYGDPAKYNTLPDGETEKLYAEAKVLTFKPNDHMMHLRGHGKITHAGRLLTGEKIDYNLTSETLYSARHTTARTTIIIPPTEQG